MTLKHAFNSAIADGADATLVRPSDWNHDHTISGNSLTLQFNNAGSLSEMSGTSWDDTNRSLTLTGATVTASHPVLDLSQTWNNAAVTFTGLKFNVTNTASAAASLLLDLQVGASSKFNVDETGNLSIASAAYLGISTDVLLLRDAAGILAQRNSTNAQTLRVYNTYTDASNYERGVFDWTTTANTLTIGTQAAGTGTLRQIKFVSATGALFTMSGQDAFTVNNWGVGLANALVYAWTTSTNPAGAGLVGLGAVSTTATVVEINNTNQGQIAGCYLHWGGQARVSGSDFSTGSNNSTLGDVTGLSVTVAAGRTYSFEAYLSWTDAAAGGVQAAIKGTCTATAIRYDGWIIDSAANGIKGNAAATALDGPVASATTTGTNGAIIIKGTITVANAGTLVVRFAQNTNNATASVVKIGSYFIVHDMP